MSLNIKRDEFQEFDSKTEEALNLETVLILFRNSIKHQD
jgi:hypothetical protein